LADSFQPRFVDLVRNYTDTTGTSNLVLGTAVPGYESFADALTVGDQFYYSIVAIETVQTEVGRGTLQADGTISREAVGGTLTDFGVGTKTVGLVVASEWFESAQAGASSAVASRAELAGLTDTSKPALLCETGREGLFMFDPSDLSVEVAADPRQALHVAPASDATGASGAWARRYSGPIHVGWYGTAGDGIADDSAALQAAFTHFETRGPGELRLGHGSFSTMGTLALLANDVTIDARGATIFSSDVNSIPMFYIGGSGTKILGGTWKVTGGFDVARPFDVDAADCTFDGVSLVKEPETGGYQMYLRSTTNGFTLIRSRLKGGLGIQVEGSNSCFLNNDFVARAAPAGTDDCLAIKAIDADTTNIRIEGNRFENFIAMCSIGSQVGMHLADDPDYSRGVYNVAVTGNTGTSCGMILYVKPGANGNVSAGSDYRDGTVQGLVCSNNVLHDPTGQRFLGGIRLCASRGARIRNVLGRNNVIVARASTTTTGHEVGMVECLIQKLDPANDPGILPSIIENVDVEVSFTDPFGGVARGQAAPVAFGGIAAGAPAPGYPVKNFCNFEMTDSSYGSMADIRVSGSGDGCSNDGCVFGANIPDEAITVDLRLKNYAVGTGSAAGVCVLSTQRVSPGTRLRSALGRFPYRFPFTGTGAVRCPELVEEVPLFNVDVAAGNTRTAWPWVAKGPCMLTRIDLGTANSVAASDTNYTSLQLRNDGASGSVFTTASTKATGSGEKTPTFSLTAGFRANIFDASELVAAATITETLFDKGDVLRAAKVDSGSGAALTDSKLSIEVAPW
jgi:hypothetical protein